MLELKTLRKIATGGQAEIFDLEDGKVLRLMFRQADKILIDYEFKSLQKVKQHGLIVPEVFEIVSIDNRPGLIMEKIDGMTMTRMIQINPLLLPKKARELGEIHNKLNKIVAPEGLMELKSRIKTFVERSQFIDSEEKTFVYDILDQLPSGDKLCHGDFHPGNIIVKGNKDYIIDWCGVTSADPIADLAETYLILRNVPRLPGMSYFGFVLLKTAGLAASKTYFKSYTKTKKIDLNYFSKWLLVRAAERTYYAMKSEKQSLVKFIHRCHKDYKADNKNYSWYKFL
jgi:uncharacterized protein (TIGR02172 family)